MADINEIDKSQKANLIDNEIKKGESDEKSVKTRTKSNNSSMYGKKSIESDKKMVNTRKEDICRAKLYAREVAKAPKTIRMPVPAKPCSPSKRNYIPRNCMTKEEWMTLISKPNRKCSPHFDEIKEKILKEVPTRINELAQPPRQRMVATLHDRGTILPAPLVDRLITVLEAESCLTPEQAEKVFRAERTKKKRNIKKIKLEKKSGEPISVDQQLKFDKDATICQYLMAETFVKSILQWESTIPKEDFQDIAEVIFGRLKQLFDRTAVDDSERGSQQMRLLADIIASWIAGILFEVAKLKEDDLEKECKERQKTLDENIEDDDSIIDTQTISDEDSIERDDDDDDDNNDDPDDNDSDDENNSYGNSAANDNDDDDDNDGNDNEDGDGDRHYRGIVVDDNKHTKNENKFHKTENKKNNDEQTDVKESLKTPIDHTVNKKKKTEDKIGNEVIKDYTMGHISHGITSGIIDTTNWYDWRQYMGSEPFVMGLYKNFVNKNNDNLAIHGEHNVDTSDETNYPRDPITEREINPNL